MTSPTPPASSPHVLTLQQRRDARLQATYGITLTQYNQMLAAQDGVCAICKVPHHPERPLVVDHDHDSGEVRGLLCSECNTGLGLLGDNPDTLLAASAYLEIHGYYAGGEHHEGLYAAPVVVQTHLDLEESAQPPNVAPTTPQKDS